MTIAVIIGTHGSAAEQLLKTTEMILGEQENVSFIDFIPGENAENLVKKYQEKRLQLDCSKGLLFLVDMWGGSPFNAANQIATDDENIEIVTGINIPMLIELFMARDDDPSMQELVDIALSSGQSGIKALKHQPPTLAPLSSQSPPPKPVLASKTPQTGHMMIALARIDDRLIHGQVATRWTKETNVKRIIVVSDEVAQDHVRKTLLTQVAPPGVTAHVVDVAKAVRVYNNPKYANERVMLLFTNPTDVLTLIQNDVAIESVNIGGMAFKQGKIQISNAVSVDDQDIKAFKEIDQLGIELEVRKVASDNRVNMMDLLKKI